MANEFLDKNGLSHLWSKIIAKIETKQDKLNFDSTPTVNSANPVTSGGVYNSLNGLTFKVSSTVPTVDDRSVITFVVEG